MPINYVDLGSSVENKKSRKFALKKPAIIILSLFALLLIVLGSFSFYFYSKYKTLSNDLNVVSAQVKTVQKGIEEQDVPKVKSSLKELRSSLKTTQKDLSKFSLLGKLPVLNGYYNDANHALKAALYGTDAGELVADSVMPFTDILGLKGSKVNVTAEEKIQILAVKVLPSLAKKSDKLEGLIRAIETEVTYLDPDRYSENLIIKGFKIRETLLMTQRSLNDFEKFLPSLRYALEAIPSILGYQSEKTYMIWFQNDKELRATGGFITAYAIAKVKNGKLVDIKSDDIYQLDLRFAPFEPPPAVLRKYLGMGIFAIRDTNLSPDYKVSAKKFESFYSKITSMPKIDGIIAVDTELVREFLEITGPIKIEKYNETFSAENNETYNIPDVIYKLELYAEKVFSGERGRKGLIGDLMNEILDRLLSAPPDQFPKILGTTREAAEQKHILAYFHDQKAQDLVENLNYAGRIKDYDGDYLHVNNSNFAGLKGNLYIKEKIEQDITISGDGTITKKVKITLSNTEKADGWLNAIYRNWMRVYVPKDSKLKEKKVYTDFAEKNDLDKTTWESYSLTYPLKESATYFSYELPFKVKKSSVYRLLVQKQPGTTDPHMIIRVNGKIFQEFDLKKDTEIKFNVKDV
ncbi:MAG: hypothetical protein A2172_00235 [Candidatus Woykebacteria bacterium RBG_13_40_15]|uniref:DUF4012 domain-containing protein n=1 Tax=Candidatus Woykebacteria bacterium RBG_13_40_15 TaxID=1802593 RepID=A0A1G1W9I2_9BACT|nr:MAG: hypothetical protein A2172_00235 [Candidatus Woykebacteria bacterium RBG_13_40_15]